MLKASFKLDDKNIYQVVSLFWIFPLSKLSNAEIFIKHYFCFHLQTNKTKDWCMFGDYPKEIFNTTLSKQW